MPSELITDGPRFSQGCTTTNATDGQLIDMANVAADFAESLEARAERETDRRYRSDVQKCAAKLRRIALRLWTVAGRHHLVVPMEKGTPAADASGPEPSPNPTQAVDS